MSNRVSTPFPIYNDTDGSPLDAGFIFIGELNKNPILSPIAIFYDAELTMPAENPARTRNGYVVKNGAPRQLFCAEPLVSIAVQNKRKEPVWNFAAVNLNPGINTDAVIDTSTGSTQSVINETILKKSLNLSDIPNKEETRANLQVYSKDEVDDKVVNATEDVRGVARLATETMAEAMTDDGSIMTPVKTKIGVKKLLNTTGTAPMYACRAWACINGHNGEVKDGGNITFVLRTGVGEYTINFVQVMPHVNYAWSASVKDDAGNGDVFITQKGTGTKSTTEIQVKVQNRSGVAVDPLEICVSIFC